MVEAILIYWMVAAAYGLYCEVVYTKLQTCKLACEIVGAKFNITPRMAFHLITVLCVLMWPLTLPLDVISYVHEKLQ